MTDTHSQGRVLAGVSVDPHARITACSSCHAAIWWGSTAAGRRCPFDVQRHADGTLERTAITHFSTCPQARLHSKRA